MMLRRLTAGPHVRQALVLWAILAVAVCVKIVKLDAHRQVYLVFAAASRHWWADKPLYITYGLEEGIDVFRYSPTFAVAFTPLAYLPDRLGAAVWILASVAILVWALHVLVRDVLPPPVGKGDRWSPWQERLFLTLTLGGSAVGIWSGQSNALVLALVALGLAAVVRRRWWTASLLLAMPVFIKIWPLAIVLLLVACWPRQLTGRFIAACLVLALIPFFDPATGSGVRAVSQLVRGPQRSASGPQRRLPRCVDFLGAPLPVDPLPGRLGGAVEPQGLLGDRAGRRVGRVGLVLMAGERGIIRRTGILACLVSRGVS